MRRRIGRRKYQFSLRSRMNRVHKRRSALSRVRVHRSNAPHISRIYRNNRLDGISTVQPKDDSFHASILPVAAFFQFMALMPVCGISRTGPKFLEFKWTSIRVICTLAYILCGIIMSILFITFILKGGISSRNFGNDKANNFNIS